VSRRPLPAEPDAGSTCVRGISSDHPRVDRVTPTVLVVDDDASTREAARMVLEDEGFTVEVARDGREALARLEGGSKPGMLLLDLSMPAMDGRTLLLVLDAHVEWCHLPIVLMTASGPSAETSGLRYPLLRKPFSVDELLRVITTYSPRLWDEDEPPTDQDSVVLRERGPVFTAADTSRDRCQICTTRASGRCPACGEAFCRRCLDTGASGRCARCVARA
jgi:CheY-like chemotaxis protein